MADLSMVLNHHIAASKGVSEPWSVKMKAGHKAKSIVVLSVT